MAPQRDDLFCLHGHLVICFSVSFQLTMLLLTTWRSAVAGYLKINNEVKHEHSKTVGVVLVASALVQGVQAEGLADRKSEKCTDGSSDE